MKVTKVPKIRSAAIFGLLVPTLFSPRAFALNPEHKLTQYVHRIWQTQPGLPQTSISAVSQTRDGYIWLGTESGVVRFDGVRFTPIPELERASLGDVWARTFVEDSGGRVWIVTSDSKLIRVGPDGAKIFGAKDGLPGGVVGCAFASQAGEIWVCTTSGIGRFNGDRLEIHAGGLQSPPLAACQAPDRTIWLAGDGWIASLDKSRFSRTALHSVPSGSGVYSMACRDDGMWVGTFRGLIRFADGKEHLYIKADGLADSVVLSLANGSRGELWIGTQDGVSRFVNGAFENFTYADGLSQKDIFSLYEDREGSLWVATKHGLNQFLDGPVTPFTRKEGLPSDNVGPVMEDRSGNLWVGFLDGGLARWDGRHFSSIRAFSSHKVTSLLETSDRTLWVGTEDGIGRLNNGWAEQSFLSKTGLPSTHIRSLFEDHAGAVWIGTDKGAVKYTNGALVEPAAFARKIDAPVVAMGETRDGQILFALEHGSLYSFSQGQLRALEDPLGPPLRNIISIQSDADGLVWMGTNGLGLRLLRNGRIYRFSMTDGLFDGEIYGSTSDTHGDLWIAGSKGFYSVAKADLLAFADGKIRKIKSNPYVPPGVLRAIQAKRGVQPNASAGRDGKLWFSTLEGLIAYDPNLGAGNHPPPPVSIEDANVNGVRTGANAIGRIGPGIENVSFHYTGFSFLDPQAMSFRYILEGYDRDWTNAGARREAFYTNLPAGKYRFRVAACAPFVPCNDVGASAPLEVVPHVYQTTWFLILTAASLVLLAWAAYRLRIAQMRSHFSLVVAERTRIARELHDTLIQGFSGITMQMQALSEELPFAERQSLEEIIGDAGECLRETRISVAGLREGEKASPGLKETITEAASRIIDGTGVRLSLRLDSEDYQMPAGAKYNLLLIVQEAVLNAVKHSGADAIEVSMVQSKSELRLCVTDNGCGANRTPQNDESRHYGIIGMRERAQDIGAEFEWDSTLGVGTTITVRIPAKKPAIFTRRPTQVRTIL